MAVTTRKRDAGAASSAKKAPAAPKKPAAKRSTKKAPVESESESEEDEAAEEETQDAQGESSDEDTFKIHTPKAAAEPRTTPAVLPTMTYEDDSEEDEDSDAAPEAESLSSAKAKVLNAQDKEKSFLTKVQAEQKAKRVEREEKLKTQKELSKKKAKTHEAKQPVEQESTPSSSTTKSGLPALLPMDILESVAQMENNKDASGASTNEKKRKHMRPEDFALMELEAELKAEAAKKKRAEKTQKNVGPVTVKVLDKSHLAKGQAIPQAIVDFRTQHFYGKRKFRRQDAVLNYSQDNSGPASKFARRR